MLFTVKVVPGVTIDDVDLNWIADIWRIPENSTKGSRSIFRGLRFTQRHEAMRVLQRALPPFDVDVPSLTASLCFFMEQGNLIQWRQGSTHGHGPHATVYLKLAEQHIDMLPHVLQTQSVLDEQRHGNRELTRETESETERQVGSRW